MQTVQWAERAWHHLCQTDPVMAGLAKQFGPAELRLSTDPFRQLVSSIVGQQISGKAAEAIRGRLFKLVGDPPNPERIAQAGEEELRQCGLSANKFACLRELSRLVLDGKFPLRELDQLSEEEIVNRLTTVRGIGRWTAVSFLLFTLGRPDVLLAEDLGVRRGVQVAYGMAELPRPGDVRKLANDSGWHPFASATNLYLWRVVS